MHHRSRLSTLAALAALAACSGHDGGLDGVSAGPQATSPACDAVLSRLPARVLDHGRSPGETAAAGVAGWGDPPIVLRCGVVPIGPTTLPCLSVDNVDWVLDDRRDRLLFTTFGRHPAIEVAVPAELGRDRAPSALVDLAPAVAPLPQTAACD